MPGSGTGHSGGGSSGGSGHSGGGFSGGSGHSGGSFSGHGFSGNSSNGNNGFFMPGGMYNNNNDDNGNRPPYSRRPGGSIVGIGIIVTVCIIISTVLSITDDINIFNDGDNEWSWVTEENIPDGQYVDSVYIPGSTWEREPFKGESEYIGLNILDESSLLIDTYMIENSVAYFSKLTGVQTVLYLTDAVYNNYKPYYDEIEKESMERYVELFGEGDESHLLITFFMYPDESYYCVPTYGFETEEVLDEEAREILLYSVDYFFEQNYYFSGVSDCIADAFNFSAERIMNGVSDDINEYFYYAGPFEEDSSADVSSQFTEETESTEGQTEETSATEATEETGQNVTGEATTIPVTENEVQKPTEEPISENEDNEEDTGFVYSRNLLIIILVAVGFIAIVIAAVATRKTDGDGDEGIYTRKDDGVERNHNPYGDYYDPGRFNRK